MNLSDHPPLPVEAPAERTPERMLGSGPLRLAVLAVGVLLIGVLTGSGWFVIIGSLTLMIFLHELGHYLTARWAGMKVTEFFLGFGPRLWSFQRGETTYGVKLIPAGAYVKVIGMYNVDDVDPGEEPRTYRQKKFHQRVVMASAGSAMHFAIAMVLIYTLLVGFGRTDTAKWKVADVVANSPAAALDLQSGDRVVEVAGEPIDRWEDLSDVVGPRLGQTVDVVVSAGDGMRTAEVLIAEHPDRPGRGFLGVSPEFGTTRENPLVAIPESGKVFGTFIVESLKGMGHVASPSGMSNFFRLVAEGRPEQTAPPTDPGTGATTTNAPDNADRPLSIYGAARLGVGLLDRGVDNYLGLLILLNIFIGVFNLVPLLPLDGGHIAVATYERVRELFRRDGRRYFVDVTKLLPLTYAVVLFLIVIGGSSLFLDIVNPVNLP